MAHLYEDQEEKSSSNIAIYENIYKELHSNPELSGQESATAARIAHHLRSLQVFTIYEHIGGHGIAAVLENGPGNTVLLRAEMDALPIFEQTKLPYASKVTQRDKNGIIQPAMHACGHDLHMSLYSQQPSILQRFNPLGLVLSFSCSSQARKAVKVPRVWWVMAYTLDLESLSRMSSWDNMSAPCVQGKSPLVVVSLSVQRIRSRLHSSDVVVMDLRQT